MNKSERGELKKLVDRRIATLKAAITTRDVELRAAAEKLILQQVSVRLAPADKRLGKLVTQLLAASKELAEIQATLPALDAELEGSMYHLTYLSDCARSLTVRPKDLTEKVSDYLSGLKVSKSKAEHYVSQLHYSLHEQLLVGALTSEDAKAFLASIPTVDKVLGIPAQLTKYIEHQSE